MILSRLIEKNTYSGYTWQIKLSSLFHIFINSTPENTFVVELKEWKWFSNKTKFSFVSKNNLEDTIKEAFDKSYEFFNSNSEFVWSENQKNDSLRKTLNLSNYLNDEITLSFFKSRSKTKPKFIEIIKGVGVDKNILNISNSRMIIQKYGEPNELINHNNYSIEMLYSEIGLSFYYKIKDNLKTIFAISVNNFCLGETETGMKFDENLTLEKVIDNYYQGKFTTSENNDSEYAKMILDGITFEMKINELNSENPGKALITKIMVI